jgi:hypothetical protein
MHSRLKPIIVAQHTVKLRELPKALSNQLRVETQRGAGVMTQGTVTSLRDEETQQLSPKWLIRSQVLKGRGYESTSLPPRMQFTD